MQKYLEMDYQSSYVRVPEGNYHDLPLLTSTAVVHMFYFAPLWVFLFTYQFPPLVSGTGTCRRRQSDVENFDSWHHPGDGSEYLDATSS